MIIKDFTSGSRKTCWKVSSSYILIPDLTDSLDYDS